MGGIKIKHGYKTFLVYPNYHSIDFGLGIGYKYVSEEN